MHNHTINETRALRYLGETKCAYTPYLLLVTAGNVERRVDEKAMYRGYVVFILMSKVPGERMNHSLFWNKPADQREEIRRAFKTALLELWARTINPPDHSMRNLMWDEQQRKCYIVDFEDYERINSEALWDDCYYRAWGLAEDDKPVGR